MSHIPASEYFSHHAPCPRCKSKDNLGVWKDGHKWCFGCRYYEPPERNLSNVHLREAVPDLEERKMGSSFVGNFNDIPVVALKWLRSYGITDAEIKFYNIGYDTRRDLLICPLDLTTGALYTGRYFGSDKNHAKSITYGTSSHGFCCYSRQTPGLGNCIIFVEDFISAIKVGRLLPAYPLLGSNIGLERLRWGCTTFEEVGIWLDRDMAEKSIVAASRGSMVYGKKVLPIITELDPKCYSDQEIFEILGNFFDVSLS